MSLCYYGNFRNYAKVAVRCTGNLFFHSRTQLFSVGESQCTLEHVLVFVSGARTIPPGGFGKPGSLEFLHSTDAVLPTSSTCDITLRIPTCFSEYDIFKDMMTLGMLGHDGFGGV